MIYQSGTTKNFTIGTLSALVGDSADQVRAELADTAAQLRSEIGGEGIWTESGDVVYLTNYGDGLYLLLNTDTDPYSGTYHLVVEGDAIVDGMLSVENYLDLGSGGYVEWTANTYVLSQNDSLKFYDAYNTSGLSLSTLAAATSHWTLDGTNLYPDATGYNVAIGKTTASYDLDVNGDIFAGDRMRADRFTLKEHGTNTELFTGSSTLAGIKVNNTVTQYWTPDTIIFLKTVVPSASGVNLGTSASKFFNAYTKNVYTDTINANGDSIVIDGNLAPSPGQSYDIGSTNNRFDDIFARSVDVYKSDDGAVSIEVENPNTGVSSLASLRVIGQGNNLYLRSYGDNHSTSANLNRIFTDAGGTSLSLGVNANNDLLWLDDGGNVGIGTNDPGEVLEVNGNITTTGNIIPTATSTYNLGASDAKWNQVWCDSIYTSKSTAWADFVFEKDYKLQRFADKMSYIKTNRHLPALKVDPDATAVNVTRRLEATVQELEEAYLYIGELERRLTELERKFETVNK